MRETDPLIEAAELLLRGESGALCTIIQVKGSVPRHAGSKMLVRQDRSFVGTVGGSVIEARVIDHALEAIRSGKAMLRSYDLILGGPPPEGSEATGMVCGGKVEVFIDPLIPYETLHIFGAGHVGFALATMAKEVGYQCVVYDDRAEWANAERFPSPMVTRVGDVEEAAKALEPGARDSVVIVTRGHQFDKDVLRAVAAKGSRYLGMISSRVKKKQIFGDLEAEGVDPALLAKVHCPIGLDIGAETPEEIAVAILAELVQNRRRG